MFVLLAITIVFTISWTPLQVCKLSSFPVNCVTLFCKFQILANQFYEHRTAEDHRSDLLAVRLASVNQILDPWVYILCRKVGRISAEAWLKFTNFLAFSFVSEEAVPVGHILSRRRNSDRSSAVLVREISIGRPLCSQL